MSLMIVLDWVLIVFDDCFLWLFLIEFWLSLMIFFMIVFYCLRWLSLRVIMIVFYDCVWRLYWLLITFDDFSLLYIFDCFIVDMYFCGCKIVCFNAFWYHLTLIHCNKWFSPLCSWFVFYVDKGGEIDKRCMNSLWDSFLYMKSMKSSTVSYKQTLQNQGGVKLCTNRYFFLLLLLLTYRWLSS